MLLTDDLGRKIDYLRISLTPKCNFNCFYCRPKGDCLPTDYPPLLKRKEIESIIRVAAEMGIKKVRLTGGEPLLKPDLIKIIRYIAGTEGIKDISLTTNGFFLAKKAAKLKEAGLNRVNISLDSLNHIKFEEITGSSSLQKIMTGMEAALKAGLTPLKINMVVIKGINDDEITDFAALTMDKDIHIRFIEYMPLGEGHDNWSQQYMPVKEIRETCAALAPLTKIEGVKGNGPAQYYRLQGAVGILGFISPISEHFCSSCNRFRITSDGKLKPCLFSKEEIDIKGSLANDADLRKAFMSAINLKPSPLSPPYLSKEICGEAKPRGMVEIGG